MNFAILNNNTVKTFSNNVIGFPSSTNDKFILKRENTNGSVSYSWIPFQHVSGNVNFTTTKYNTYLTTEKQSINIESNDTGLIVIDILIDDIATLDDLQASFERLTSGQDDAVKILIDPNKHKIVEI